MATLALYGASPLRLARRIAERLLLPALGLLTLFGGWALVSSLELVSPHFLPSPFAVLTTMVELTHEPYAGSTLQQHLLASLDKFAVSYALSVAIGVPLGLLMGRFEILDWVVTPVFEAFRYIPPIAWVPFSILWFGTGFLAPTLVIFAATFAPCLLNAYRGVRLIDGTLLEVAQGLGAGRLRTMTEVLLPGALPHIVAGLRVSAGFGWQSLIGAELIVGSTGLGYMIVQGESNVAPSVVLAGMITIGLVGASIDYGLRKVEDRIRRNWGPSGP
ncbi:ABC transporter permease [Bradyrhizobium sp. AZCC 2289]|uniref:ABC transporter permease n=1 Tax=Bradyrhizobium sp. AZCC 2289 TaxID=3117026 RepID=UPI002FEEA316